jgi:hypothetical protein
MGDEDEDDFLTEVIEFGDGTQYTVKPEQVGPADGPETSTQRSDDGPVRKEDRFAEDFDRSWPRGPPSSTSVAAPFPLPASSLPTVHDGPPPRSGDGRALFNERSNRLEHPRTFRGQDGSMDRPSIPPTAVWGRRNLSESEASKSSWEPTSHPSTPHSGNRDPPPHSNVQVLQKPSLSVRLGFDNMPSAGSQKRGAILSTPLAVETLSPLSDRQALSPASSNAGLPRVS